MSRKLLIISAVLGLIGSYSAFAAKMPTDIVGVYNCKGNDPTITPSNYTSKYTISIQGHQYIMADKVSDGAKMIGFDQFAIRKGNVLTIAYQRTKDLKIFGTESMTISDHGKYLTGIFSYWGEPNKIGTETCQRAN